MGFCCLLFDGSVSVVFVLFVVCCVFFFFFLRKECHLEVFSRVF